jgi:hypothetical protein
MDPDSGTFSPSLSELMAQAVGESRNEDRHELGPSLENEAANAGLGI